MDCLLCLREPSRAAERLLSRHTLNVTRDTSHPQHEQTCIPTRKHVYIFKSSLNASIPACSEVETKGVLCVCCGHEKHTHSAHTHIQLHKYPSCTDTRAGGDYVKQHVLTWTWIWRSYFWNTENRMDYTHTHNTHIDRYTIWKGWFGRDEEQQLPSSSQSEIVRS